MHSNSRSNSKKVDHFGFGCFRPSVCTENFDMVIINCLCIRTVCRVNLFTPATSRVRAMRPEGPRFLCHIVQNCFMIFDYLQSLTPLQGLSQRTLMGLVCRSRLDPKSVFIFGQLQLVFRLLTQMLKDSGSPTVPTGTGKIPHKWNCFTAR
jgi:hypothetical protein